MTATQTRTAFAPIAPIAPLTGAACPRASTLTGSSQVACRPSTSCYPA